MTLKLTFIIAVIVLIIALAGWLLYVNYNPNYMGVPQDSAQNFNGDSTATIQSDLNQVPDDSTVNGDMDSLDASLQAF